MNSLVFRVGGEAGWGIATTARILAKVSLKLGYYSFVSQEYASQIKRGHNYHNIRISTQPVNADLDSVDLLLALDQQTLNQHSNSLSSKGQVLFNFDLDLKNPPSNYWAVDVSAVEQELNEKNLNNAVFLGATIKLLGINWEILSQVMTEFFSDKPKLQSVLLKAAQAGYDSIETKVKLDFFNPLNVELLDGNSVISAGALKARLKFHAQYPMTPVSGILHYLAKEALTNSELVVIQPEDEIAAINMAIGASYTGVRAMTATSGGGFSLMVESLGLASMAEVPLVIVLGQRPGPATGLPTKNEQGDLKFALSAGQGDFPRVVIAPGDLAECYTEIKRAFYLAEKYQLPVILLVDKHLMESVGCINLNKEEPNFTFDYSQSINVLNSIPLNMLNADGLFQRYASNNLMRTLPGTENGIYTCAGDEHNDVGYITEDSGIRIKMMQRRMNKLISIEKELSLPQILGNPQANCLVVGWGSTKGTILEVIEKSNGKAKFLPIKYLLPFPSQAIKDILSQTQKVILVENNYSGQLGELIREKTGIEIKDKILRYDGKTFTVNELYDELNKKW